MNAAGCLRGEHLHAVGGLQLLPWIVFVRRVRARAVSTRAGGGGGIEERQARAQVAC